MEQVTGEKILTNKQSINVVELNSLYREVVHCGALIMIDRVTPTQRSSMMSAVKNKNTKPEVIVRKQVFAAGFRYRLHARQRTSTPDLIFPRYQVAVFVHGCFWHGHDCPKGKLPTTNLKFWRDKISKNMERDQRVTKDLRDDGWKVVTIWSCQLEEGIKSLLTLLREERKKF